MSSKSNKNAGSQPSTTLKSGARQDWNVARQLVTYHPFWFTYKSIVAPMRCGAVRMNARVRTLSCCHSLSAAWNATFFSVLRFHSFRSFKKPKNIEMHRDKITEFTSSMSSVCSMCLHMWPFNVYRRCREPTARLKLKTDVRNWLKSIICAMHSSRPNNIFEKSTLISTNTPKEKKS